MKRIIYILLVLSISASLLTACMIDPTPAVTDVKIYDEASTVTLVKGASLGTAESAEAQERVAEAFELLGISTSATTDLYKKEGVEIVIGGSYRDVSKKAETYLYENAVLGSDDDKDAILVYCDGDSVAVIATSARALPAAADYFIKTYLTAKTLTVKSDLADLQYVSYSAYLEQKETESWEGRFDKAYAVMGEEAATALEHLYEYYGAETCEWLAGLYDPEIGAFYYSASARDNYPFLPDVESTAQALSFFRFSGIMGSGTSVELFKQFPDEIREGFYNFALSLRADDGYFYHPQWGTNIGSSRKGRDYDQANSLLNWFADVAPTAAVSRVVRAQVIAVATLDLPEWMTSFGTGDTSKTDEYLESLKVHQDSHSAGHTLSSQTSQIKMVPGLYDYICDYLDQRQEEIQAQLRKAGKPENGLWELEANYRSLSGLIKIGSFYGSRQVNYSDKMLDGAISVILSDKTSEAELSQIVYIFNPWGGLSVCVENQLSANKAARAAGLPEPNDMSATYQKIYDAFPEMVDVTIKKLRLFRQEQGSYSYYQSGSAPTTQGVPVSLGVAEGDVNGTICAIQYTLDAIFGSIGVPNIPLNKTSQFSDLLSAMTEGGEIVKNPIAEKTEHTFDGSELSYLISVSGAVTAEIVTDPTADDNTVLSVITPDGSYGTVAVSSDYIMGTEKSFVFTSDMYFVPDTYSSSAQQTMTHQIYLQNGGKNAYMLYLEVKGNRVYIKDNSNAANMTYINDLTFVAEMGEWFNLRVEYYPMDDGTMKAKIFKNGVLLAISDNHYGKDTDIAAGKAIKGVQIACMTRTTSELLLDNVMSYGTDTVFDGVAPAEAETVFDFEDGKQPAYVTSSEGSTTVSGGELVFTDAASANGVLNFYPSSYLNSVSCFIFEIDMTVETSDSGDLYQIYFQKNTAYGGQAGYMLVIKAVDGKIVIEDHSTPSADPTVVISAEAAEIGEAFNLRVEYYPIYEKNEDTGALEIKTVKFKVFSGSTLLGESENCYVRDSGAVVRNGIVDYVYILGLKAPASTMEIDNVGMYYSQEIEYEEE